MSLQTKEMNFIIEKVQKQLLAFDRSLELVCIIHHTGKRKLACQSLRKGYMSEDIAPTLNKLLSPWIKEERNDTQSEFLGTIETYKRIFGGLFKKRLLISFITLNRDLYTSAYELEMDLYRLAWNACNAFKNNTNKEKNNHNNRLLIPSPKGLRILGNNLQADIFSALTYSLINKEDKILDLAQRRAQSVISINSSFKPENYPFIMTLDQTKHMYNQLSNRKKISIPLMEQVWAASKVTLQTMNKNKLQVWKTFAHYAHDMAWRGFPGEVILSIAVDRNDDIESKKLGVQISALTNIKPVSPDDSNGYYNPFRSEKENAAIHKDLIEDTFESLLTRAIFENSIQPFIDKADEQNGKLKKGQFMGWCAVALQDAATIFEKSLKAKLPPTQTTREFFKNSLQLINLDKLKELSEDILIFKKERAEFSDRDFIIFLENNPKYKAISESVLKSLRKNKINQKSFAPFFDGTYDEEQHNNNGAEYSDPNDLQDSIVRH